MRATEFVVGSQPWIIPQHYLPFIKFSSIILDSGVAEQTKKILIASLQSEIWAELRAAKYVKGKDLISWEKNIQ